jgi:Fe-S cluster assembly protein SufD
MTAVASSYIAEAERVATGRRHADPDWLARARREALDRFDRLGFPTTRDEDWRFTSVAPIAEARLALPRSGMTPATRGDVAARQWPGPRAATLVFVNGRFVQGLSEAAGVPPGVCAGSLADAIGHSADVVEAHLTRLSDNPPQAFTALNTAFVDDGAFVYVPDGMILEAPVHFLFLSAGGSDPVMVHPRVLVVMGVNSQATVVESYGASHEARYLTNVVTEIAAGRNSILHHYKVQDEAAASFHVGGMHVRAARDASVTCHSINLGGSLVRNDLRVALNGEGAECALNGVYLSDGARLVDNHTTIDHTQPNCVSRELYKGILADRGRAVFNGRIVVRPDAQKTDARQTSKALLLSADAQINTNPQLEIFANDVKCTHGAAIGQMDDEAMFYLRARGLGPADARHMLIRAFAGEVLDRMSVAPLRARLEDELLRRLPEMRA